ncbi:hypothetical protein B0J17DRAFT_631478 [Rhizoctonia solani]|nr:hypothetical protein B0J17DRAFT_631478 [Rhizoctonia solani]
MTNSMSLSNQNGTTTLDSRGTSSTLVRSLTGPLQPRCYLFANAYPEHAKHIDKEVKDMVINQQSIKFDLQGLFYWIGQLDLETKIPFKLYCDDENRTPAKLKRIGSKVAGHTETKTIATQPPDVQLTYVPADHLDVSPSAQLKLIPYETMRQWLLNNLHSESLLFITEVGLDLERSLYWGANLIVFDKLSIALSSGPPLYKVSHTKLSTTEVKHGGRKPTITAASKESRAIFVIKVHFAATSPGERAMCFGDIGAIFTKAFYNINPNEPLALKNIAEKLQRNVDTIMSSHPQRNSQRPKIYSSRIIDEPHFFVALGFCSSSSTVETDSDSMDGTWVWEAWLQGPRGGPKLCEKALTAAQAPALRKH